MFQTTSNLKILREALSSHLELSQYFLGIHTFFDGEVIFARDVVQVNVDLGPFPVDFANVWEWFREQLSGPASQETFAYELPFAVQASDDPIMEKLIELTTLAPKTIWMIDLSNQEDPETGRRFVIVTVPDKKHAKAFRETYHGKPVHPD
ncbi:hypothetical protein [Rhizobium sp. 16-449-1b]|uniref:hypothetical protein n=1 Tax=Rhizobium sp. 16-449-1b TaxID=2819989 RepID=UPI001FFDF024|nr:hypothetical protein [Rhizobium sp. 16-449-1b]